MSEEQPQEGKAVKKSFVSPDNPTDTGEATEPKVMEPAVTLMLIYGKLVEILNELKALNQTFSKAKTTQTPTGSITTSIESAPTPTPQPALAPDQPKPISPRLLQIRQKFDQFKDLVTLDEESDTMFVVVKPKQFLGSENFSKIGAVVRELGGNYVSQGKASHFKISKAEPRKT